jgi:hypothetical protein
MMTTAFKEASSSAKAQFLKLLDAFRKFRPDGVKAPDEMLRMLAGCYRQIADELAAKQLFPDARGAYEHAMLLDVDLRAALVAAVVSTYLTQGELLLAEGRPEAAVEVLTIAREMLPEEQKVTDALEEAEFKTALKIAGSTRPLAERMQTLQAFLLKPCSDERRAKGEKELTRLQAMLRELKVRAIRDLNKYSPLSTGSEFKYKRGSGISEVRRVVSVVESSESLSAEIETTSTVGGVPISFHHVMTQTEAELFVRRDGRRDSLLKFPVSVGVSWDWQEGRVHVRRKYVATNATIATPAGEFKNCLKVEMRTRTSFEVDSNLPVEVLSYHYFAPGVGLVKVEFPDSVLQDLGIELTSYSLK